MRKKPEKNESNGNLPQKSNSEGNTPPTPIDSHQLSLWKNYLDTAGGESNESGCDAPSSAPTPPLGESNGLTPVEVIALRNGLPGENGTD
jgi:hypothetical protein